MYAKPVTQRNIFFVLPEMELCHCHVLNFNFKVPRRLFFKELFGNLLVLRKWGFTFNVFKNRQVLSGNHSKSDLISFGLEKTFSSLYTMLPNFKF